MKAHPSYHYENKQLCVEQVALSAIAEDIGTPCYVYSRSDIEKNWEAFNRALQNKSDLICYAVKANSNLAILNVLARKGSGFDIVSGGELQRVLKAGGDPAKIVFSGVGKTAQEMEQALQAGIHCFNIESRAELEALNRVAGGLNKIAPISVRVNPDVDPKTHPYISTGLKQNKFGIPMSEVFELYQLANRMSNIRVAGIDCHIGSQLIDINPFISAVNIVLDLAEKLLAAGILLQHIDIGGGLGIIYENEKVPKPDEYIATVKECFTQRGAAVASLGLIVEPGRSIVGPAGLLLTRTLYLKENNEYNFAIVDAAMNDFMRPALYGGWHRVLPVNQPLPGAEEKIYDIVGPVCETGDFLAKKRELHIKANDVLALCDVGAYGSVMGSNYNTRSHVAEVMVDGEEYFVIRERQSVEEIYQREKILPA